jgi:hypothetical protein
LVPNYKPTSKSCPTPRRQVEGADGAGQVEQLAGQRTAWSHMKIRRKSGKNLLTTAGWLNKAGTLG